MKKRLTLLLVLALTLAMTATLMASADTIESGGSDNGSTDLTYTVASTYSITIPADSSGPATNQSNTLGTGWLYVNFGMLIDDGKALYVKVKSEDNFDATDKYRLRLYKEGATSGTYDEQTDNYVKYRLEYEEGGGAKTEVTTNDAVILTVPAGTVQFQADVPVSTTVHGYTKLTYSRSVSFKWSGEYKDTLTFTASVGPYPAP